MSSEVAQVVDEMNEIIFNLCHNIVYVPWFEHIVLPMGEYVKYCGQYIYDSENDYRPVGEDGNLQDLKQHLIEQVAMISLSVEKTLSKLVLDNE